MGLAPWHLLLIAFIVLLLFMNRLPAVMQSLGDGFREGLNCRYCGRRYAAELSRLSVLPADQIAFGLKLPATWGAPKMAQQPPKIAPASTMHRWLRIDPGYAPKWIKPASCEVPTLITFPVVGLTWYLFVTGAGWWMIAPALIIGLLMLRLEMRFEARERLGRARLRRGECIWCGHAGRESGEFLSNLQPNYVNP